MLSLIVAYDKNKTIGNENTIPWRLKADMLRVKNLTTNQTIVMGRKTFESIGRALPNRINRILTRNRNSLVQHKNIEVYDDKKAILENVETDKIFIFGGSAIYNEYIDMCDEMFITEVDASIKGDSKFPEVDFNNWQLISEEKFVADEYNEYDYKFLHLIKKKEDK